MFLVLGALPAHAPGEDTTTLKRNYRKGEVVDYQMSASNRDRDKVTSYEAKAHGVVTKEVAGSFVEDFTWSGLRFDGHAIPLPSTGASVQQQLSLDPTYKLSIPDLSKAPPALIGPMVDLLTFYADVQLAIRQGTLHRAGDHAYVRHPKPNSWADHVRTLIGEDAIDFDITLTAVNQPDKAATLVVRHVPPAKPEVTLPAEWMRSPVADTANNWVQVQREGGKYVASVGKEVFTDRINLSLTDGRILSATMDNPVEVMERDCSDEKLNNCGDGRRYRISRRVEIRSVGVERKDLR